MSNSWGDNDEHDEGHARRRHEAVERANEKVGVAAEKMADSYNDLLFEQTNRYRDNSVDETQARLSLHIVTHMELKVARSVGRLERRQQSQVYRDIASALIHKANTCDHIDETADAACEQLNKEVNER